MSIIMLLACPILMFYCQYWPIYTAARDETSNHGIIISQNAVLIAMGIMLLGIPGTGMIGIGYTILCWNSGQLSNVIIACVFTGWHSMNIILESFLIQFLDSIAQPRGRLVNPVDRMEEP